jgi:hypothetical protein
MRIPPRFLHAFVVAVFAICLPSALRADEASALSGRWRIDLAHSTEHSPWQDYELTGTIENGQITLARSMAWGIRHYTDTMTVHAGKTKTVPVVMWPDNRHLGAYISDDHSKRVHAEWLDGERILRLSTDLTLETQQGSRAVNILSDYKVSASGNQMILTELRSTRNRPIVYVFNRVSSK